MKKSFIVEGMHCAGCAVKIEKALQKLDDKASVNYATKKASFTADEKDAKSAVKDLGYALVLEEKKFDTKTLVLTIILSAVTMFLAMQSFIIIPYSEYAQFVLASFVVFYAGRNFHISAIKQARHFSTSMDTLISLGTIITWLYSTYALFLATNLPLFFESAAMIITFILLGRYLEEKSKQRAQNSIKSLLALQQKKAILYKKGIEKEVEVSELKKGDKIIVKPGMNIPIDGIIFKGEGSIDESTLTGESTAVFKKKGDKVFASTINKDGALIIIVKETKNTLLQQIIDYVDETQTNKAPIQRIADKTSSFFIPIIFGIAIITLILWLNTNESIAIIAAVSVLVIACPCALGLATPIAVLVGSSKAAKNGILFKTGESIELLNKAKYVVFDKTGTLTKAELKVTNVFSDSLDNTVVLRFAASLEQDSEHPIGKAIVKEAKHKKIKFGKCSKFKAIPGKGVTGRLATEIIVGTLAFMKEHNTKLGVYRAKAEHYEKGGATVVYVAKLDMCIGLIVLEDEIKPDAQLTIRRIKEQNKIPVLLTGDNPLTAESVAKKLGIEIVFSQVLPVEKADKINELQAEGKVVMIGDGVNDAPALTKADVGIALSKGSDIAIQSADITLLGGKILKVPEAINLSKQSFKIIKQNLYWAFLYNVLAIPIAAGALYTNYGILLNPMIASGAMALSSLSVVLNSLRVK